MQKVNVSHEFDPIVKVHNNNSKANLDRINIRKNNIETYTNEKHHVFQSSTRIYTLKIAEWN